VPESVDDAAEAFHLLDEGEVVVTGEAGGDEGVEGCGEVVDRVCDRRPECCLVFPHRNSEHHATDIRSGLCVVVENPVEGRFVDDRLRGR
jgi:hypothetical protein